MIDLIAAALVGAGLAWLLILRPFAHWARVFA